MGFGEDLFAARCRGALLSFVGIDSGLGSFIETAEVELVAVVRTCRFLHVASLFVSYDFRFWILNGV